VDTGTTINQAQPTDETVLVARLRAGDEEAFEILVRLYGGRLFATARRFVRIEDDARDAVQEAFLSAYRSIDRFEGGSSLSTWLHRIVINACLMKLRSASRRPEASIEELLPRFDETGHRIAPEGAWPISAEQALLQDETRRRVRAAIERLPLQYRAVLMLRDIQEASTEEAAQVLGITPNAVKIRLHRARQALRTLLSPEMGAAAPARGASVRRLEATS
jgi:RNA polymerase sigma-70 factor (ECF subfamily)